MGDSELIWPEIGVDPQHVSEAGGEGRFQVICDKAWLQSLERNRRLTHFPSWPQLDRRAYPTGQLEHPWTRILVQTYRKQPQARVYPLPRTSAEGPSPDLPLSYSQAVSFVAQSNFKQLWEEAYRKYDGAHVKLCRSTPSALSAKPPSGQGQLQPHDVVLKELIQRVYQCPVLHSQLDREGIGDSPTAPTSSSGSCHANVLPALVAIESSTHFSVFFYPPALECSLYDCITFSPALLGKNYNKTLFVIYQILQLAKHLQGQGLFLGDLRLQHIVLRENLWLQVLPRLQCNLLEDDPAGEDMSPLTPLASEDLGETGDQQQPLPSSGTMFDLHFAYDPAHFNLREYAEMWCNGQLSNFDYLTILNNACGRSLTNAAHHHIMPWVTDFNGRGGAAWRDLTKSKYRLNKGDVHLDLMYAHASQHGAGDGSYQPVGDQAPHHVSDFLSEITYFVYMARRTPQAVLCAHVRPIWVPAEYPVSIQRLQEWTPDECIPEFYSDPMIFKSIHEDLPDLELPAWATCPEDFICKHREALESQYVSERLHHWIDLNFGYKLSGKAAVKSKNVCLTLVDQHRNLSQRGIVQLFANAHPPRRYATPWFSKTAPRLSQLYASPSKRLAKSTENLQVEAGTGSSNLSLRLGDEGSIHSSSASASASNFYAITNFIELPANYNPALLLNNLETLETFYARTFPQQRASANPEEKMISSDLLFEQNSAEHSFTNQLFASGGEIPTKSKNLLKEKKNCLQHLVNARKERDLQVLGCLIVELFAMQRLRPLLMGNGLSASFEARLSACRTVAQMHRQELPKPVRRVVRLLLQIEDSNEVDQGLPQPPSPAQLVEPMFANLLLPFPSHYTAVYALVRSLHAFEANAVLLELNTHFNCKGGRECARYTEMDRQRVLFERKIAECKVMSCCAHVKRLLEPVAFAYEQFTPVELLLPHIIDLLRDERTSILTAWNLFDPIAQALGVAQTQQHLLQPLLKLYDVEGVSSQEDGGSNGSNSSGGHLRFSASSSFKSRKSVKLYHHSFLLRLVVRFGLRCFLHHFIAPLIEAVGGYKEPEQGNGYHYHSGGSRRTSKNLNFAVEEEEEVHHTTEPETKPDIEELFTFEDDQDRVSIQDSKSIDSFDMRPSTSAASAEEARESDGSPDKLVINELIYGARISPDKLSLREGQTPPALVPPPLGPRSPTIEIPLCPTAGGIRRSFQLSAIDCDIGSRKSVDSFELISQAVEQLPAAAVETETEASDSLQASVISRLSEAKAVQNNRISEMSAESLVWLSHRLGPVLTSRFITRNLLKLLSLCYVGQENLLPEVDDGGFSSSPEAANLNYFSIANARVVGDRSAARVLECLMSIAALYGENFLLLQYFPHISELIGLCSKRITGSLEGAIISSLQLLKYMVPCLTDASIMEHLQHILLDAILLPILRLLSSTNLLMPSGYLGRSLLARKFLDAIYALSVRLGSDMTREHLCQSLLSPFFLIFNKAFGLPNDFACDLANLSLVGGASQQERALEELRDVFGPELAHTAYLTFLRFLGEANMKRTLTNLEFVLTLCHEHEQPSGDGQSKAQSATSVSSGQDLDSVDASCELAANSFGTQIVGNRLQVARNNVELIDMVAYKLDQMPSTRHLKGNWLAYWRNETTRSEKDNQTLNLKQIRLQSFVGHTNSVRAIYALDNENSFISASKDKTVKLWSLRSEGDGRKTTACQFTYTAHKKSINSLGFLESLRYVVSCDSGIHLWDPFIGRPLGILDAPRHSAVTVVKCLPSHSPLVIAGTAESTVKMVDARSLEYVNEWRVCNATLPNATVRCLAVAPSGNWLAAGLSSGCIVQLDTRTGMVINSWRPMECDLLQLAAPSDQFLVSSALDHSLAVWHALDGIMHYQLKPPPEPAHFLQSVGSSLVYATTGNRVGVYADVAHSHAFNTITKLRSETFRGVLTSLAVLPLNRAFLAGNESGNIALLC